LSKSTVQLSTVPNTTDSTLRFLLLSPKDSKGVSLLMPGVYYRVTLLVKEGGGILSASKLPLEGLNSPEGFSWMFRVQTGENAYCKPSNVTVTPSEKYETLVGARQGFLAVPTSESDQCSKDGQILMSLSSYAWSIDDPDVATLLYNGALDTSEERVDGCSESCTLTGSQGQFGKVATCGDHKVQTVNASYCISGRTPSGASCIILPVGSSGSEECDEDSDYCNSRCLWEPVDSASVPPGTCGDKTVQANEDCDFGSVCTGAKAESKIADGTDCSKAVLRKACTDAGGTCEPRETRGCSIFCRHLGSRAGGSTCGNEDIADGEDCDDGNSVNGDGCSANCLIEGSSNEMTSLCGNGKKEAGESCEKISGVFPAGCDPKTCLNNGTSVCAKVTDSGCCGNGAKETGEDCDGSEGCSQQCLFKGSSEDYSTPSFCGDGKQGFGEASACDPSSVIGDGIDAYQIAETVGKASVPKGETVMSTLIHAVYEEKAGTAIYGLQCGYTREDQCTSVDSKTGLTDAGCCSERPALVDNVPSDLNTDVCRNVLISGDFSTVMDTASLTSAFIVGQRITGEDCPTNQETLSVTRLDKPIGFIGTLVRTWNAIRVFFGGVDAYAQAICAGGVTGKMNYVTVTAEDGHEFTRFYYTLDHVLDPSALTVVLFKGDRGPDGKINLADNTAVSGKTGIRTANGVVADRDYQWQFTTGDEICTVNQVEVQDMNTETPGLFLHADEEHPFVATAQSWRGGRMVVISSTEEYAWKWQNWAISNSLIAELKPETVPLDQQASAVSSEAVVSKRVNGSGYVNARVIITKDSASEKSTVGRVVQGTTPIVVSVCENPWPIRSEAPFRDEEGSSSLVGTPFQSGPYYNFSMMYCRDAGDIGPLGDLPSLVINGAPTNTVDEKQGILRQYLFTFAEPELKKDAIGVRIASNPLHLSPSEWYLSKGFVGKPQELTIDGYQAVRDGRTVYISAVSTEGPGEKLYSNIYIISYNDGAESVTRQIYDALLSSFLFNRNIQVDIAGVCQQVGGSLVSGEDGAPVYCSSDIDCDAYDPSDETNSAGSVNCANFKTKVQRDLIRLSDFGKMTRLLETSKVSLASYPNLREGSYVSGMTTSLWPSWKDTLGKTVGGELPKDPLNKFVTCGLCDISKTACATNADCPSEGGSCVSQDGFDPLTCWSTDKLQFACAKQNASSVPTSRIYMYEGQDVGARYRLSSEFEIRKTEGTWWPALPSEVRECVSGRMGIFCANDEDCRVCPNNNCDSVAVVSGSCQLVGGSYRYQDICTGDTLGQSTVCGDGILSTNESSPEVCETVGPNASKYVSCTTAGGKPGYQRKVCNACREYVDDPNASCVEASFCGNGILDGSCGGDVTKPCQESADCTNSQCILTESCDDGLENGTYGHCNLTCDGYDAYCGDGTRSGGETCDNGTRNTEWIESSTLSSCNLSCTDKANYCGDGNIDTPFEVCDGNIETTEKGLCDSDKTKACSSSADCSTGTCGAYSSTKACTAVSLCENPTSSYQVPVYTCATAQATALCESLGGTCSTEKIQLYRSRACDASCRLEEWGGCDFAHECGNGTVEGTEACDDGNTIETDGCTSVCKKNVCGDGNPYKGVEECDLGSDNGTGCLVSAEYGSTCTGCSTSCKTQLSQGGFCGDGVITPGTAEQCDGTSTIDKAKITCTTIGYDYLKPGLSQVQCSQSCGYTGCAYCGEAPPEGMSTEYYTGRVEGALFDSMFQQYVPNARIVLFYKGLQTAITTSDEKGYFEFTGLDIHTGCDKYRMMVDSYTDNPNTSMLDESKRGGYQLIETPLFRPHTSAIASENGTKGFFTSIVMGIGGMAKLVPHPKGNGYQIPQFNMLPRLYDHEYIVQLWWNPKNSDILTKFKTAAQKDTANGNTNEVTKIYANYLAELHDLVIRLPFTYKPGTYERCKIGRQLIYNPDSTNATINGRINWNISASAGIEGTPYYGMGGCTNKIRATFGKTCQVVEKSTGSVVQTTNIGCLSGKTCIFQGISYNADTQDLACTGPAEGARQGSPKVFEGQEGAYLSCFHPEWLGIDDEKAKEVDCGNFIVPPQTVFIHAESGQYDILVSKYLLGDDSDTLHYGTTKNDNSIRTWLVQRGAYITIFDKNGIKKNITTSATNWDKVSSKYWSVENDYSRVCLAEADRNLNSWTKGMSKQLTQLMERSYNPVWTPASIKGSSPSTSAIKLWNNGNAGANLHFFSDLIYKWEVNGYDSGGAYCWERACKNMSGILPSGTKICQGPRGGYSSLQQTASGDPVCTDSNDSRRCVMKCTSDADCTKPDTYCGGISNCVSCPTCGTVKPRTDL
jgi:cysteine-rich repeat protein